MEGEKEKEEEQQQKLQDKRGPYQKEFDRWIL
jgi:hypothetical protein